MLNTIFKIRCAAIILIAAGYGSAGHYIPAGSNVLAYLFQFIVIGVLVVLAVGFFSMAETGRGKRNWAVKGLSIFAVLSRIINILNIVHGAFNHDLHSFGSHNTFADLVPIAILLTGTSLWVVTLLVVNRAGR